MFYVCVFFRRDVTGMDQRCFKSGGYISEVKVDLYHAPELVPMCLVARVTKGWPICSLLFSDKAGDGVIYSFLSLFLKYIFLIYLYKSGADFTIIHNITAYLIFFIPSLLIFFILTGISS